MMLAYAATWVPYLAVLGRGTLAAGRQAAVALCRKIA
jgi:hypothetical protein